MDMAHCVMAMGIQYTDGRYEVVVSDDEGRKNMRIARHNTIADAKSCLAYYAKKAGLALTLGGCGAESTDGRTVKADGTYRKFEHRIFF